MLINFEGLVSKVIESDHAVPCITVTGYEDARTVIKAAEYLKQPVILAVDQHLVQSKGISKAAAFLKELADSVSVPVGLQLNSGFTRDQVVEAIHSGFGIVAFDGSLLSLEDNILATLEMVKIAHASGVSVEGTISSDDVFAAEALVRDSGIDALKVAEDTVTDIAEKVEIPLVATLQETASRQLTIGGITKYDLGSVLTETFIEKFEKEMSEACDEAERESVLRKTVPVIQEFSCKQLRQFYRPVIQVSESRSPIWGFPARD